MGEIATWSAVKTKVGLGKDSNECPTKAELLALSPTGTGENYVGLEISNASSYGNNETVQLSDIHKVTYKYTFTVDRTTLSFPASGGAPSPNLGFGLVSRKQKYVDGVISGSYTEVGSTQTAYPDWVSYNQTVPQYEAKENTGLVERSANITHTQNESGKQITVQFTQDAGVETWEYLFSVTNSTMKYEAIGGTSTTGNGYIGVYSKKQRYINGNIDGGLIDVEYSGASFPSWLSYNSDNKTQVSENKSESTREFIQKVTQAESGKTLNVTFTQAAGVKTYGNITITPTSEITDIPAAGGTSGIFTYSYSQPWGWNGKTNDGGTITSGATASWSNAVSGSNLGTTPKARTKLGTRTLTLTQNGKSGTATKDVYQAANAVTKTTQGAWEVSISANPSTFTDQGGTSQISASARAPRTNTWSSGATNAASDATGTPTLSIPTAVTGFSLSGTTLTVAENTTANQRSVVVRATMDTVYKEVTVTQSAYLVEWVYIMTSTQPTLNFNALGTTKTCTITSYREKYINGSLVEGSMEGVNIQVKSTSSNIKSTGSTNVREITMEENTTTQARTGTVVYEQVGSGKTQTITCNQAAGTVTTRDVLELVVNFDSTTSAKGGSDYAIVKSGYYDVINGKDTTFHTVVPTIASKSPAFTNVDITIYSSTTCKISVEVAENTHEYPRDVSLTLNLGSKQLSLRTTQSGASVGWSYELKVNNGTQDLNQQVPAKPNGTYSFAISSKRYKIINGSVTSQSEDTTWTTSIPGSPSWIHVEENGNTLIVSVDENTTTSKRSADITIFQTGSGDTSITLTVEQQATTITTRDFIDYVEPIPSGDFSVLEQSVTVTLQSYRETLTNGTVTNKVAVQPDFELDATVTDWASVSLIGGNSLNYEYDFEISVKQNNTINTRSGSVMFYNGTAEVENAWAFTQDGATPEISYDIYWALSDRGNTAIKRVTSYTLDPAGEADRVHLILLCDKVTKVNGTETARTPVSTGLSNLTNYGPVYTRESDGEPEDLIQDDGGANATILSNIFPGQDYSNRGSTYQIVIGSSPNEDIYQKTIIMTYNRDVMDGSTAAGKVPAFYWVVDNMPYQSYFDFAWNGMGGTTINITLAGSLMDASTVGMDIESARVYTRNGKEFKRTYIKPVVANTPPDWLQVIDNGQNSTNTYNWVFRAITDNEGSEARNTSVRFEQPGNSNQALYAYVSQDPKSVIRKELHVRLGNYYSYGASDIIPLTYQGYSPDSSDNISTGDTTPGGYIDVWCNLPATGVINCMITGKPTTGKPMKARLNNIQVRTIDENAYPEVETNQGLSVGYSQQDYKLGIEYSPGMNTYFLITPEILSGSGEYGGGIRVEVALRTFYSQNGTTIATITLTPKNPDHPIIYFELIYG